MTFKQAMLKHIPKIWKGKFMFKEEILSDFKSHFDKRGEKGVKQAAAVWFDKSGKWNKCDFFPRTYT